MGAAADRNAACRCGSGVKMKRCCGELRLPRRIFIGGVPACGKTYFTDWLGATHGYFVVHSDDSSDKELEAQALRAPRLAIEYGFDPESALPAVRDLPQAGFVLAWLKPADIDVARIAFRERERRKPEWDRWPMTAFEEQVQNIEAWWPEIEEVFAPRIVTTLDEKGRRMAPEEILRIILSPLPRTVHSPGS